MISVILQLLGSAFLSWNAITKNLRVRALEAQFTIPKGIGVDLNNALKIQSRYYLNITGFSILFLGYLMQVLEFDYKLVGTFSYGFLATTVLFIGYLLYLFVNFLSKKTANSLVESSKIPAAGNFYLYINNH